MGVSESFQGDGQGGYLSSIRKFVMNYQVVPSSGFSAHLHVSDGDLLHTTVRVSMLEAPMHQHQRAWTAA